MKILSYGDNPKTSTGYGQIWDNLLSRWAKEKPDWKFYHCGWQSHDREYQTREGYYIIPINKVEYGFDTVYKNLIQYSPDVLLTMADVGITAGFIDAVNDARKKGWRGKWIAISLFDTESWEHMLWNKILDLPDINLAGAINGKYHMENNNVKNVRYIPFGVDTKTYYPLANRDDLRKRFNLTNKFVVGFVGKNQRRKMQPYLIKGFIKFAKGKDDVKLLLHTDVNSGAGWDIPSLLHKFEKEIDSELQTKTKVIFTKQNLDVLARQSITPENMNEIYNLMDVFCYAVGGEGYGLPGIECQCAGVPLLMTDYSAAMEILCDRDLAIPVLLDEYGERVTEIGANGIENAIPNDTKVAELLEKVYTEWKDGKLKDRNERARNFALKYDWESISNKFLKLFQDEA